MKTTTHTRTSLRLAAVAMSALTLSAAPATAAISATDLTNYWQLDGDLTDSVGSANGTIVDEDGGGDNTSFSTGFDGTAGGALNFAGTTDHVATGAFTVPLGTKSISLFFTMNSATNQVFAGANNSQRFYFGGRANGAAWVGLGGGGAGSTPLPSAHFTPTGTNIAFDNTYHHMVLNDNGSGTRTLYYRSPSDSGYLVSTRAYTGTTGGVGDFLIGALGNGGAAVLNLVADGRIDDVALFNRELTAAEAESIWDAGSVAGAIPEPSAISLLALAGLACLRRRRR
ncbi:MAG TPA: LamG-like jellyroll fold domain-containing protein [Roseibacillus sp.]|nr:LamG-like jellyroll fold domain-containing protein [Roseibacillus sp.]